MGSDSNDHALISCTVGGGLLPYRDPVDQAQDTGKPKLKKIDPKQLPRILTTKAQRYHATNSQRHP